MKRLDIFPVDAVDALHLVLARRHRERAGDALAVGCGHHQGPVALGIVGEAEREGARGVDLERLAVERGRSTRHAPPDHERALRKLAVEGEGDLGESGGRR
jgi:hypothetical protein